MFPCHVCHRGRGGAIISYFNSTCWTDSCSVPVQVVPADVAMSRIKRRQHDGPVAQTAVVNCFCTDTWLWHHWQTRAPTKLQSAARGSQLLGKSRVNLVEAGKLVAEHGGVPRISQVGGEVGQGSGAGGD